MASGVALRESVKEMKRLKNETAFNAGHYRDYPFRWILRGIPGDPGYHVPQRTGLYAAVPESPLVHSPEKQPVHDPDLHGVLHGGGIPLCIRYCPVGCSCKGLFRLLTLLPIVSPPFIVALSYILLFGVQGIVTKQLLGLPC